MKEEEKNSSPDKEAITEYVLTRINSYVKIAQGFLDQKITENKFSSDLYHIGILFDNIGEEIDKVKPFYDILNI